MTKTTLSLADLNTRKASETPFVFEYILPDGSGSGIKLKVLGAQSPAVVKATSDLVNERRRKDAVRAAEAGPGRVAEQITPVEEDIEFGQRTAATRLVGWEGIAEEWSADNALQLCRDNPEVAAQVLAQSNKLSNFTSASPKT
jgi:hypothetical protein